MIVTRTRRAPTSALPLVAAAVLALASSSPARAQSSGETSTVAESLFRDGVTLFDSGHVHDACEKFAESFRLDPANGTLQNLALCHDREGKTASAWVEFSQLAGRAASADQKDRERMARKRAAELDPRVAHLRLRFGAANNVERVLIDGQELGRAAWTSPLPLDPGAHTVLFTAPHAIASQTAMSIDGGGQTAFVDVPMLANKPPVEAPTRGGDHQSRRITAIVVASIGLVAVGVGAYFGIQTLSKKSDGDARCSGRFCDAEGLALESDAHTDATVSTVAFTVGVVALAASAVLWLTSPSTSAGDVAHGHRARDPIARLRLVPDVRPHAAGLGAVLTW